MISVHLVPVEEDAGGVGRSQQPGIFPTGKESENKKTTNLFSYFSPTTIYFFYFFYLSVENSTSSTYK